MGYDVHITRKANHWLEKKGETIPLSEWTHYVENDPEMHMDGYAEITVNESRLRTEFEGIAVWLNYSKNTKNENKAWFHHNDGEIAVKNPDPEIIDKMIRIAVNLNAKVQGDDGEFYYGNSEIDPDLVEFDDDCDESKDKIPTSNTKTSQTSNEIIITHSSPRKNPGKYEYYAYDDGFKIQISRKGFSIEGFIFGFTRFYKYGLWQFGSRVGLFSLMPVMITYKQLPHPQNYIAAIIVLLLANLIIGIFSNEWLHRFNTNKMQYIGPTRGNNPTEAIQLIHDLYYSHEK